MRSERKLTPFWMVWAMVFPTGTSRMIIIPMSRPHKRTRSIRFLRSGSGMSSLYALAVIWSFEQSSSSEFVWGKVLDGVQINDGR
jgi:hypothetical protein